MKNEFIENIKTNIIDRLYNYEDTKHYLCDVGLLLTESENCNGSWYCNSWKAKQELKENYEIFSFVWDEMKFNFGSEFVADLNPFKDPEHVHVVMMIELYQMIFDLAVQDFDEWNEEIVIDSDFIDRVRVALANVYLDF